MKLYEEYFKRHGISIPTVQHCNHGSLLLRTTNPKYWPSRWILAKIKWEPDPDHPGKYCFNLLQPVHDGCSKGNIFSSIENPTRLEWDEYEHFILDWVWNLKDAKPITGHRPVILNAWEMFVFCYDSWFQRQNYDFKENLLYKSIDEELSQEDRYIGYQDTLIYLSSHHPAVLSAWKSEVLSQISNYSDWLVRLIQSKHK